MTRRFLDYLVSSSLNPTRTDDHVDRSWSYLKHSGINIQWHARTTSSVLITA